MKEFWNGFEKRAEDHGPGADIAEVSGLGALAIPSLRHFAKKHEMSPGKYHALELAGLGVLAIPSAYRLGKWTMNKLKGNKA